jgi:hypothetical protein
MATDLISPARLKRIEKLSVDNQRTFWLLYHQKRKDYSEEMDKIWRSLEELEWLELKERTRQNEN